MKLVQDFKSQNPSYKDIPDAELAGALYKKFYADKMPIEQFEQMVMGEGYNSGAIPMPEYDFNPVQSGIIGAGQGVTFGLADEMAGVVGGGLSALKGDSFRAGYEDVMSEQQRAIQASKEQNPISSLTGEIAGAVGTGIAGGTALAGTKLLQSAGLPTATGLGALSGGLYEYNTGFGGAGERLEGVPTATALGGLGGLAGGLISRGVSSGVERVKNLGSSINKSLKGALGGGGVDVAPETANMADELVGLGGKPLSQTDDISIAAAQGKQITMPKGAATGDVELMRLEEAARQGQFGQDLQRQITSVDEKTKLDILNKIQTMVGKTTDESDELLSKGIKVVQGRYKAGKKLQNKLMSARNDAIAKTTVYKDYVQNTLGRQVDDLAKTPDFQVALMRADNAPIKDDIKILKSILNTKSATGVNFKFLQAWRAGLNDYYGKGQQGALATQVSRTYDDWLDNVALSDAIKAGDEDIAEKIFTANKEYSKFKSLYGTDRYKGQNSAIENILTKEDLTPIQAVNTLFGKSVDGNNFTAQNLRRIFKGVQGTPKEGVLRNNFRGGLVLRAFEDAKKTGDFNLNRFKNNLIKLKNSEAYKMNLSSPDFDVVMNGLIDDIGKVVSAQSRRDVYSPSAPLVIRYLSSMFDKMGYVLPSTRAAATGLEQVGKAASSRPAQKKVERSIQEILKEAEKVMSNNTAIYGSITGGAIPSIIREDNE